MRPLQAVSAPNKDRWLLSYADLLTLLLAFFVVMYSVSKVDAERLAKVSSGLDVAFNSSNNSLGPLSSSLPDSVPSALPNEGPAELVTSELPLPVEQSLAEFLPDSFDVSAESADWFEISIGSSLLFKAGSATLSGDSPVIDILPVLRLASGDIVVEGHTDNQPIATQQYPSNWELSAARAAAVVRIFEGQGLAASRLAALGLGASRPMASNKTAVGRTQNRRVIIKIRQQGFDPAGLVTEADLLPASPSPGISFPVTPGQDEVETDDGWLENIDPSMLEEILDNMEKQEASA
ncbi:MAG: chemotaxis protein MotB [Candidatus Azotimanducaceae bacterium]|jgi:chemotaxis protein MotB